MNFLKKTIHRHTEIHGENIEGHNVNIYSIVIRIGNFQQKCRSCQEDSTKEDGWRLHVPIRAEYFTATMTLIPVLALRPGFMMILSVKSERKESCLSESPTWDTHHKHVFVLYKRRHKAHAEDILLGIWALSLCDGVKSWTRG